ncbi:DUF3817 domain-containing protein [Paenibacillus sp. P96]|uniref:DUF3817 domain-containing protein n=1 Tax=Paenibacillus zeirhizosphaerae TaxID=2987519 RepID=A0ABT9FQN3_9BACL|nr:DUF3817 domain-containing protein [Paenibacillus sp. P96]MDP4097039.1 DUF3817 domain-containing protein [Paenibacillus sp. P96]
MSGRILQLLRIVGNFEAVSYLLLVFIAMPLKYLADKPAMVSVVGMAHGILFVLYVVAILAALLIRKLTLKQAIIGFIASLLPFGPFVFDRKVLNKNNIPTRPANPKA